MAVMRNGMAGSATDAVIFKWECNFSRVRRILVREFDPDVRMCVRIFCGV